MSLGYPILMKPDIVRYWLAGSVVFSLFVSSSAVAQIIPDATLPVNSLVTSGCTVCTIDGGTVRGANLFHSFKEFSIPTGGAAWFNNAAAIQTILTRVTGNSISTIDGLIRTNGIANLFLLNPNGILFGANARLNVAGSFVATTASSFQFPDGSEFSAINPQAPPLLAINITPGLQYGTSRPSAAIATRGNLTAGQDLTLVADTLDLQGQLQAGKNLTLQAQNTVQIRDSSTLPFVASSGGDLLVQGNNTVDIFALNHANSGFFAGKDLVLRSPNIIGDAHYTSGGNVRIEQLDSSPGSWYSPNDPIIRASGDVSFDSYTGASLHIFAGGSVTANRITINATDAVNFINETVTLSNGTPLPINGSSRATLDVRAGTTAFGIPGASAGGIFLPTTPATIGSGTSANIAIATIINTAQPRSLVYLTNQYQPNALTGNITVGAISTNNNSAAGGGSVVIDGRNAVTVNGRINTSSGAGNGGTVTLLANGDLAVNTPNTANPPVFGASIFTAGQLGGSITLKSNATIALTGTGDRRLFPINSTSTTNISGGKGGDIEITGRVVTLNRSGTVTAATNGRANSGDVRITATEAIALNSSEASTLVFAPARGRGGNLTITTPSLSLNNRGQIIAGTLGSGNTGDILINADLISLDNLSQMGTNVQLPAPGQLPATGNAGDFTINTRSLSANNASTIFTSTFARGNAGNLTIAAQESILLDGASRTLTTVEAGAIGRGGNTTITTGSLTALNGSQIRTTTRGPQSAGNVTISADRIWFDGVGSNVGQPSGITSEVISDRTTTGSGTGSGGNIDIQTRSLSFTNGARINASTQSTSPIPGQGKAGNLTITGADSISLTGDNTGFLALTDDGSTGDAGKITLESPTLTIQAGARISVDSRGSGRGGDIQIQANRITLDDRGVISADTASTNGGNINLQVQDILLLRRGSRISTNAGTALAGGDGGNITINAPNGFLIAVSNENSDIAANAFQGRGGRVQINAQGIFGIQVRSQLTPKSDITASSTFGINGVVEIKTPDVDPSKSLTALSSGLIDSASLVSQSCSGSSTARKQGEFIITGRGGLPAPPSAAFDGQPVWQDLRAFTLQTGRAPAEPSKIAPPSKAIIEAQGWVVSQDGQVELIAQAPNTMAHQSWLPQIDCKDEVNGKSAIAE
ncbi:filamentous hemagglutinin N-terminal domain-containing protein [Leptolyngbyaceae cyanobacterium UHCC 1019]